MITNCMDTEIHLMNFLNVNDIINLTLLSKASDVINTVGLVIELKKFIKIYRRDTHEDKIIDFASKHNYFFILNWWKNNPHLNFSYSVKAIDSTYNINTLNW